MADLSTIDQVASLVDESEIVMDSNIDPDAIADSGVFPDELIAVMLEEDMRATRK